MHLFLRVFCILLGTTPVLAFDHQYPALAKTLTDIVVYEGSKSSVNYKKLQKNSKSLNLFLKELQKLSAKEFETFSSDQKKAFWINAYNAFTLKIVTDYYPIKSIKDIGSVFKNTWKIDFAIIMGKTMNLDHIEHKILRPQFSDPRIRFAINCASISCPKLRNEPYQADRLEIQLNEQTKEFIRDTDRNSIQVDQKKLSLSKIFTWFKEDFTKDNQSVQQYVAQWISDDPLVLEALKSNSFTEDSIEYDWKLNEVKN